jgi:predicted RNA-binding Zn ribbon-like protein
LDAYAGEVIDPRPLTGEPLPLDLLNTTWIAADGPHDLLADEPGARLWLDAHGFDAPADARARRALRDAREAMRELLLDRSAIEPINAVLEHGARRPVVSAAGVGDEVDAPAAWRVPWICAAALVELLEARGDRIRGCANPECVLWFLDTSRPGTRRWCSMAACGNRDKALRHGRIRHR